MGVDIVKEEIVPVCPYCENEVHELVEVKRGVFAIVMVFCCPHCRRILGISSGA